MEQVTLLWIVGAGLVPFIGWCITITFILLSIRHAITTEIQNDITKIIHAQQYPESTGFGKLIKDNTEAIKALTHYVKWLAITQTGSEPPPPL